ncbi:hypothetical protein [Nannocystis pusilla]|uniref:Uncharacterized protein n=1 Tax=Nannocystis pusilla TaxID=889268 RepID=A0ABS7TMP7_9BACT|nr:hypothetical protein [Nannocystis pusilla]MBZ5709499.1 hypothetical protein [Nannocystis pusilla]
MLLLTQAPDPLPDDGDDIVASTRAARLAGFTALHLPPDADHRGDLLAPIAELAVRERREPAVWVGTIPEPATYRAVYAALRDRGVDLVNDPDQHLGVMELDQAYPRLADLTPGSVVVTELDHVHRDLLRVSPRIARRARDARTDRSRLPPPAMSCRARPPSLCAWPPN